MSHCPLILNCSWDEVVLAGSLYTGDWIVPVDTSEDESGGTFPGGGTYGQITDVVLSNHTDVLLDVTSYKDDQPLAITISPTLTTAFYRCNGCTNTKPTPKKGPDLYTVLAFGVLGVAVWLWYKNNR
jgi:hypothetical protein